MNDMTHISFPLSGRVGRGKCAMVSSEDFDISLQKWSIGSDGYARRKATKLEMEAGSPSNISMHRQILGLHLSKGVPGVSEVDHINGVRLDNRRENLRVVNRAQNNMNRHSGVGRSKFVGVSLFKPANLWRAYVNLNGKRVDLGYFKSEMDAARARDKFCAENVPFAKMNLGGDL